MDSKFHWSKNFSPGLHANDFFNCYAWYDPNHVTVTVAGGPPFRSMQSTRLIKPFVSHQPARETCTRSRGLTNIRAGLIAKKIKVKNYFKPSNVEREGYQTIASIVGGLSGPKWSYQSSKAVYYFKKQKAKAKVERISKKNEKFCCYAQVKALIPVLLRLVPWA